MTVHHIRKDDTKKPEEPYKASLPDIMDMAAMMEGHEAPTRVMLIIQRPDSQVRFWNDGVNQLEAIGLLEAVKVALVTYVPEEAEDD